MYWKGRNMMEYRYVLLPVHNFKELGEFILRDKELPEINGNSLAKYIDYEAVGKNFAMNVKGRFIDIGFEYMKGSE